MQRDAALGAPHNAHAHAPTCRLATLLAPDNVRSGAAMKHKNSPGYSGNGFSLIFAILTRLGNSIRAPGSGPMHAPPQERVQPPRPLPPNNNASYHEHHTIKQGTGKGKGNDAQSRKMVCLGLPGCTLLPCPGLPACSLLLCPDAISKPDQHISQNTQNHCPFHWCEQLCVHCVRANALSRLCVILFGGVFAPYAPCVPLLEHAPSFTLQPGSACTSP